MTGDWIMVAVGILLTAGTAVFVAGEFSLVTIDPAVIGDSDDSEGTDPAGPGLACGTAACAPPCGISPRS